VNVQQAIITRAQDLVKELSDLIVVLSGDRTDRLPALALCRLGAYVDEVANRLGDLTELVQVRRPAGDE
jgi:hypothetical protein